MQEPLEQLIEMSRVLGDPTQDLVILGEGNTSVRTEDGSFWVKSSGTQLVSASPATFVRVASKPILEALDADSLDDEQIKRLLKSSTLEGSQAPSIETFLHALCLELEGVHFVGHTHPTTVVGLLCSQHSRELFAGSLFPDQIVLLGPSFVYVPYEDPGLPLAQTVKDGIEQFLETHNRVPRVILMENHGMIALGSTARQVINITQMFVKTCRILNCTLSAGGPRFLTQDNVDRIDKRPDELNRRADLR
jgi:rhamnose utilization protein RhaD (predicted bifunctional aldolase and dehydrogenase)